MVGTVFYSGSFKYEMDTYYYLHHVPLWLKVHRGFYFAYHNTTVRPVVVNAVKRTRKLYGKFPVMVTGHSMGGAMASFCALDLAVSMIWFSQAHSQLLLFHTLHCIYIHLCICLSASNKISAFENLNKHMKQSHFTGFFSVVQLKL